MKVLDDYVGLYEIAAEAVKNSYSPYSNFKVGAAIMTETGEIFTGVNVENASYGACICAERTAACKAVSEGFRNFRAIAIAGCTGGKEAEEKPGKYEKAWPCGICRQFLFEFSKDMDVITGDSEDDLECIKLSELLINGFTLDSRKNNTTEGK